MGPPAPLPPANARRAPLTALCTAVEVDRTNIVAPQIVDEDDLSSPCHPCLPNDDLSGNRRRGD
jgi:hypothetical protein